MRIAILSPTADSPAAEYHDGRELVVSALTEGLTARGVHVTVFAPACGGNSTGGRLTALDGANGDCSVARVRECLHIGELFERADEFDLIHNHVGALPITYASLVKTPLLTTIYGCPSEDVMPVYRQYDQKTYYVASRESERSSELTYFELVDHCSGLVDDYLAVYERIIDKTKREDHRPWGYYEVLSDTADHKVKRIVVYPRQRLSLQRHRLRWEHWTVIGGTPVVTRNEEEIVLGPGQSIDIPRGAAHRIFNPGEEIVVFIEVQMGEYFGEDDIERFEDDYGRM